jgi:hypothetical protein
VHNRRPSKLLILPETGYTERVLPNTTKISREIADVHEYSAKDRFGHIPDTRNQRTNGVNCLL